MDYKSCALGKTCFFLKNRLLLELNQPSKSAEILHQLFTRKCLQLPITASKVIRLPNLSLLENSTFRDDPNFSIIYLFRDPRGMFNSRKKTVHEWTKYPRKWLEEHVGVQCDHFRENLDYLSSPKGSWLKGKILGVRYEDLALEPRSQLQRTYDFIGSEASLDDLLDTFLSLTHGGSHSGNDTKKDEDLNIIGGVYYDRSSGLTVHHESRTYSTERESSEVVFKWKDELDWEEVSAIEGNCTRPLLSQLGYKFLGSPAEFERLQNLKFRNDTTFWPIDPNFDLSLT